MCAKPRPPPPQSAPVPSFIRDAIGGRGYVDLIRGRKALVTGQPSTTTARAPLQVDEIKLTSFHHCHVGLRPPWHAARASWCSIRTGFAQYVSGQSCSTGARASSKPRSHTAAMSSEPPATPATPRAPPPMCRVVVFPCIKLTHSWFGTHVILADIGSLGSFTHTHTHTSRPKHPIPNTTTTTNIHFLVQLPRCVAGERPVPLQRRVA